MLLYLDLNFQGSGLKDLQLFSYKSWSPRYDYPLSLTKAIKRAYTIIMPANPPYLFIGICAKEANANDS